MELALVFLVKLLNCSLLIKYCSLLPARMKDAEGCNKRALMLHAESI